MEETRKKFLLRDLLELHGGEKKFFKKLEILLLKDKIPLCKALQNLGFDLPKARFYSCFPREKMILSNGFRARIMRFYDDFVEKTKLTKDVHNKLRDLKSKEEEYLYKEVVKQSLEGWSDINKIIAKPRLESYRYIFKNGAQYVKELFDETKTSKNIKAQLYFADIILKENPNITLTNDERYLKLENQNYKEVNMIMLPKRDKSDILNYELINEKELLLSKIKELKLIKPISKKQEMFLKTEADIAIYGGAAGGGKTFALLLEFLYYYKVVGFNGVIFRQNTTQIKQGGGLWDVATQLYSNLNCKINNTQNFISFEKYSSRIDFKYLQRDSEITNWQGAQYPLICFDELTHFTKKQFFYLLTRNRNTLGLRSKMRATCNPDKESWLREFIDWWIGEDGYPIESRCGVVRYLIHYEDEYYWFESEDEAIKEFPGQKTKGVTFINANIYDNQVLLESDPNYLSSLKAAPKLFKERLLKGNWDIVPSAGSYFKRGDFRIVNAVPVEMRSKVRAWDFANSEVTEVNPDPDYTVGLLLGMDNQGYLYILDIKRVRYRISEVHDLIKSVAMTDGIEVIVRIPEDPGSSGKGNVDTIKKMLNGYVVRSKRPTKNKEIRALRVSSQAGAGNIRILKGSWNNEVLNELEAFPTKGNHDDIVDALSDAHDQICDGISSPLVIEKPPIFL